MKAYPHTRKGNSVSLNSGTQPPPPTAGTQLALLGLSFAKGNMVSLTVD
jgi:hypothetical protein